MQAPAEPQLKVLAFDDERARLDALKRVLHLQLPCAVTTKEENNVAIQSLQSLPAIDRRLKRRPARWRTSGGRGPRSSVGFRRWGVMSRAV